jgi:hypothetical protein
MRASKPTVLLGAVVAAGVAALMAYQPLVRADSTSSRHAPRSAATSPQDLTAGMARQVAWP